MAELLSTSHWIQFFRNAGLPSNVAANYAIIFFDNRIQLDMLMELSKEYLYDMGIKVMGDVIAILRHAKDYHNQLTKEKMIGPAEPPSLKSKSGSPASRILEHYTKPSRPTLKAVRPSAPLPQKEQSRPVLKMKPTTPVASVKKRLAAPPQSKEVATKQPRRVLPEEEGAYAIKMPTGNTERSRKLLQQSPGLKRSVFHRLGDSQVSSSTDVKRASTTSSVFKRLGPSSAISSEVSTSTVRGSMLRVETSQQPQPKTIISLRKSLPQSSLSVFKRVGNPLTKPSIESKRTVINSTSRTINAATGVSQINQILFSLKNEDSPQSRTLQSRGIFASKRGKDSVANRLGVVPRRMQSTKMTALNIGLVKKAVKRPGVPMRQAAPTSSVFQRLGK